VLQSTFAMSKITLVAALLLLASTASYADNCEEIRGQIDAKIKASGVANYSVLVVDSAVSAGGKVVGSCAQGAKKIMYTQLATASTATDKPAVMQPATAIQPVIKAKLPAQTAPDKILTECKDGSTSVGGNCKK
jgi:Protein of unknown function (DUF1161)